MAFDPLSSQGIANAMYGGVQAAQAIHACLLDKKPDDTAGKSAPTRQLVHPALRQYQAQASRIFDAYLAHRHSFYGDEQRWPQQAFWQRRHLSKVCIA
jgi:flavin-dependent dehydrogenase